MRSLIPSAIVADGRRRILLGSAWEARFRIRERLMRRTRTIRERTSLFGRVVVRFRIWRFIHRQIAKRAPGWAFYAARRAGITWIASKTAASLVRFARSRTPAVLSFDGGR